MEDIVQMAKDAARYRWLRDNWSTPVYEALYSGEASPVALDEAIDAEMREPA